jgi:hypothetical protein
VEVVAGSYEVHDDISFEEETEKNMKNLGEDTQCPDRYSRQSPSECKSESTYAVRGYCEVGR